MKQVAYVLDTTTVIYYSEITGKDYVGNTNYPAILLKTAKGNHDHGGKLPKDKFVFKPGTKIIVRYATTSKRWWIKFPYCNGCSLKSKAKEGIDFAFI